MVPEGGNRRFHPIPVEDHRSQAYRNRGTRLPDDLIFRAPFLGQVGHAGRQVLREHYREKPCKGIAPQSRVSIPGGLPVEHSGSQTVLRQIMNCPTDSLPAQAVVFGGNGQADLGIPLHAQEQTGILLRSRRFRLDGNGKRRRTVWCNPSYRRPVGIMQEKAPIPFTVKPEGAVQRQPGRQFPQTNGSTKTRGRQGASDIIPRDLRILDSARGQNRYQADRVVSLNPASHPLLEHPDDSVFRVGFPDPRHGHRAIRGGIRTTASHLDMPDHVQ